MNVKENLRPVPLKNDAVLGYHGNFRKLDVDWHEYLYKSDLLVIVIVKYFWFDRIFRKKSLW